MSAANPFPGLQSFEPEQSDLFFGRDQEIDDLIELIRTHRFIGVTGTSGSGKSSLIRAGLIPELHQGLMTGVGCEWRMVIVRPGRDAFRALAKELGSQFDVSLDLTFDLLHESSQGLAIFSQGHLRPTENLLIVVDQFEELIRFRNSAERLRSGDVASSFIRLLLTATGRGILRPDQSSLQPIYVVITLRSEYLGKCAQLPGLPEALNEGQYLVPQMERFQLEQAIEGPLEMSGASIKQDLKQRLLNEGSGRPDQLPLLQHAMMRLWSVSNTDRIEGKPIDFTHYRTIGDGIENALNQAADLVCKNLKARDPANEQIIRRMFQRLAEPGLGDEEVRRPTALSELWAITKTHEQSLRIVVDAFHSEGFLAISNDADPIVDVTHESLIRRWNTLNLWVKEEFRGAALYRRLAETTAQKGAYYRQQDLARALDWRNKEQPNAVWASRYPVEHTSFENAMSFLRRSRRSQIYGRIWRGGVVCMMFILVALTTYGVQSAIYNKQKATENQAEAVGLVDTAFDELTAEANHRKSRAFVQKLLKEALTTLNDLADRNGSDEFMMAQLATTHALLANVQSRLSKDYETRGAEDDAIFMQNESRTNIREAQKFLESLDALPSSGETLRLSVLGYTAIATFALESHDLTEQRQIADQINHALKAPGLQKSLWNQYDPTILDYRADLYESVAKLRANLGNGTESLTDYGYCVSEEQHAASVIEENVSDPSDLLSSDRGGNLVGDLSGAIECIKGELRAGGQSYVAAGQLYVEVDAVNQLIDVALEEIKHWKPKKLDDLGHVQDKRGELYELQADVLVARGKTKKAVDAYRKSAQEYTDAANTWRQILKAQPGNRDVRDRLARSLQEAAFFEIFADQPKLAIEDSKEALHFAGSDEYRETSICTNLAHGYLFDNQFEVAEGVYKKHRDEELPSGRRFNEVVLEDFQRFTDAGLTHSDMAKIIALMQGGNSN